jgi:hypothetical protein
MYRVNCPRQLHRGETTVIDEVQPLSDLPFAWDSQTNHVLAIQLAGSSTLQRISFERNTSLTVKSRVCWDEARTGGHCLLLRAVLTPSIVYHC